MSSHDWGLLLTGYYLGVGTLQLLFWLQMHLNQERQQWHDKKAEGVAEEGRS